LPWSRWHWLVVVALGAVWVLDGLEVTIVGAVGARLTERGALGLSHQELGLAGTAYVAGGAAGALVLGYLTDRLGRKRLFVATLLIYLAGTVATAFAWDFWSFGFFRFITGLGIGGEYAAINSAVEELVPARVRGWVDLAVNGSYWLGAAVGGALSGVLLSPRIFAVDVGWRLGFGLGALVGLFIVFLRRVLPESPRWLVTHGREEEAEAVLAGIEDEVGRSTGRPELPEAEGSIRIQPREGTGFGEIVRTLFKTYPRRSFVSFALLATQGFLYNAVLFTFSDGLTRFFGVPSARSGIYLVPFATANFLGAVLLGRLFDTAGRRRMISGTYLIAAAGAVVTGALFRSDMISAAGFVGLLSATFFFASAAASAGNLTVCEVFPLETRAVAIAFFQAISLAIGAAAGPGLFGSLIQTGRREALFLGYAAAAALMAAAAVIEALFGIDAEQASLEDIAEPLSTRAAHASESE
jgi:MFS family permease